MRKLKNERFSTKVENHLDKFYMGYLTEEKIKEFTARLDSHCKKDKKEVVAMVKILKNAIDKYYINNKIEYKYIYFSNLYEIYDMLCLYFYKNSKFAKLDEEGERKMKIVSFTDTGLFGYQTAFSKDINKKIDNIMSRLFTTISESTLRYINPIRPESKRRLEKEVKEICNKETFVETDEKKIKKEVAYINSILNRIKYIRDNIKLVSLDIEEDADDIRIKRNIKGTMTRLENTLELITKEI